MRCWSHRMIISRGAHVSDFLSRLGAMHPAALMAVICMGWRSRHQILNAARKQRARAETSLLWQFLSGCSRLLLFRVLFSRCWNVFLRSTLWLDRMFRFLAVAEANVVMEMSWKPVCMRIEDPWGMFLQLLTIIMSDVLFVRLIVVICCHYGWMNGWGLSVRMPEDSRTQLCILYLRVQNVSKFFLVALILSVSRRVGRRKTISQWQTMHHHQERNSHEYGRGLVPQ